MVIFDVETNGVARKLRGHTRQIQSLRFVFRTGCVEMVRPDRCAVGPEMAGTFSVRPRTGNAFFGICRMVRECEQLGLRLRCISRSYILLISKFCHAIYVYHPMSSMLIYHTRLACFSWPPSLKNNQPSSMFHHPNPSNESFPPLPSDLRQQIPKKSIQPWQRNKRLKMQNIQPVLRSSRHSGTTS